MDVSIPKRRVMGLIAEGVEAEGSVAGLQLAAQWREQGWVDAAGADDEAVGTLLDFEMIAGLDAEGVEDSGGEGDLTFGGNFDDHGVSPYGKARLVRWAGQGSGRRRSIRCFEGPAYPGGVSI